MKFAVILSSVRGERSGGKVGRLVSKKLKDRGHDVEIVDPKVNVFPMLDLMYKEFPKWKAPKTIEEVHRIFEGSDGFIIVSAEYNHSVPPALKNLIDHYEKEFWFKPGGIVTYSSGIYGGARVAPHLRVILGELGMVTPSIMVQIPTADESIDEKGEFKEEWLEKKLQKFYDEFEWYAEALKVKRNEGAPF